LGSLLSGLLRPAPKLWILSLAGLISLALWLAGCGESPPAPEASTRAAQTVQATLAPTPTPLPPTAAPTPHVGVVEAGSAIPTGFNPLLPDNAPSQRVTDNLFDSLLRVNAQSAVLEPALASQWTLSTEGVTVTFRLRDDVLWHDGQPFTADDVVYTFDAIRDPKLGSPFQANLAGVARFYAPDRQSFVVALTYPDCSALYAIGQVPILPRHLLAGKDSPAEGFNTTNPVGTGPFKFKAKLPGGEVHLERNERYFAGAPQFPEWTYRPISETQQLVRDLETGAVDLAPVPRETIGAFSAGSPVSVTAYLQPEYYVVILNTAYPPLADVKTRQALAEAIDRSRLVQEVLQGHGRVIESSWLPGHWASSGPAASLEYNPDVARRLFSEAGWEDQNKDGLLDKKGVPLEISLSVNVENPLRKGAALAVQHDWITNGVSAEVHFVNFPSLVEKLFAHKFQAAIFSWPVHPDPDQSQIWASGEAEKYVGFNFGSYSNPSVDDALARGLAAAGCDGPARAKAYQQAVAALAQDRPYIFLFVPEAFLAANRQLAGVQPGPYADLSWNIPQWRWPR